MGQIYQEHLIQCNFSFSHVRSLDLEYLLTFIYCQSASQLKCLPSYYLMGKEGMLEILDWFIRGMRYQVLLQFLKRSPMRGYLLCFRELVLQIIDSKNLDQPFGLLRAFDHFCIITDFVRVAVQNFCFCKVIGDLKRTLILRLLGMSYLEFNT